jgi:hypothetical protein
VGLYDAFLPIALVADITTTADGSLLPPIELDLDDVATAAERQREFTGQVWQTGPQFLVGGRRLNQEPLKMTLSAFVTEGKLQGLLKSLASRLQRVAEHPVYRENADPLWPDDEHGKGFTNCLDFMLTAGWELYQTLQKDEAFKALVDAVEALPFDSHVEIWTNGCSLPWAILYPEPFDVDWSDEEKEAGRHPEKLWGFRFSIECLVKDGHKRLANPVYRERFVSMCLNPHIDNDVPSSDVYKPVVEHRLFYEKLPGFSDKERLEGFQQIKAFLQNQTPSATTLIYFYCPGASADPAEGKAEQLELERKRFITPTTIGPTFDRFPRRPLVFLNSCSSGAFSPLVFTSFLDKFRENGAEGMVASSFAVPCAPCSVDYRRDIGKLQ